MYRKGLFILLLFFCVKLSAQGVGFKKQLDSIQKLRKLSKDPDLDLEKRIVYAKQASELSYKTEVDSVIVKSNNNLISNYLKMRDYNQVKVLSYKNLKLSKKIKDSLSIAFVSKSLGECYYASFPEIQTDSAYKYYNQSLNIYNALNDGLQSAIVLRKIAIIQKNEKDFIGSEITSIKALNILDNLEQSNEVREHKSYTYNNLGIVFDELEQFEESIKYFTKSLKLKKKLKGDFEGSIVLTQNNLIKVYRQLGQYDEAIKNYNEIINNAKIINNYPDLYVVALGNYANTLYIKNKNHKNLPGLYLKALKVCDSIKDTYKSIIIYQHLAEYYNYKNQKDSALYHGYKAKEISEQFYKDDLLKSLLVLAKIETDSIAVKHYAAYIKLNDSIQHQERLKRNKFARIQFETDQYIKKAEELDNQNGLIIGIASTLVLILGLLYFIRVQRSKNKELVYQSEQEKANQELYKLMLAQQNKLEEGRLYERHRIAEELHDGILSRLFGTRMGMGFLNVEGDSKTLADYNQYINEMQGIEQDIRDVSHELKSDVLFSKTSFETLVYDYIKSQSVIGNFKYTITNIHVVFKDLNESIRLELYRIIQEAVQNIVKYAQAKQVNITFTKQEQTVDLTIKDDGIGFNTKAKHKGIGLKNMASRVKKLEGQFKIDAIPKQGTNIRITIPLIKTDA